MIAYSFPSIETNLLSGDQEQEQEENSRGREQEEADLVAQVPQENEGEADQGVHELSGQKKYLCLPGLSRRTRRSHGERARHDGIQYAKKISFEFHRSKFRSTSRWSRALMTCTPTPLTQLLSISFDYCSPSLC